TRLHGHGLTLLWMNLLGTSHRFWAGPRSGPRLSFDCTPWAGSRAAGRTRGMARPLAECVNTPLGVVNVQFGWPPPSPWRPGPRPGPSWLRRPARDLRP